MQECNSCQRHQRQQQREPILQPEPPSYPWQRLNSDLFDFKGHQYLLVSDQYSKFPVIRKLSSTTSAAVITHLKSIFAEYGIPSQLVIDNGPEYSALHHLLWNRAHHQFPTLSTSQRIFRTHGTDS